MYPLVARSSCRSSLWTARGAGPDCNVKAVVTGSVPNGNASAGVSRNVKLGSASFGIQAGKKGNVSVRLSRQGLKLLRRLKTIRAKVTITVRRGATSAKKTVTVTVKAPKRSERRARRKRGRG